MGKLGIAVAVGFLAGAVAVMLLVSYLTDDLELATVLAAPVGEPAGQPAEPTVRASARTLAAVMRTPSDFEQTAMLYQLLRDADAAAIERLLAEADELRPAREGHAAKSIIVARYAELDPDAAVQAVMADGGDMVLVRSVFAAWGKMDHEAALESARDLPEVTGRHAAMAVLTVADALSDGQRRSVARAFSVLPAFEQGAGSGASPAGSGRGLERCARDPWRAGPGRRRASALADRLPVGGHRPPRGAGRGPVATLFGPAKDLARQPRRPLGRERPGCGDDLGASPVLVGRTDAHAGEHRARHRRGLSARGDRVRGHAGPSPAPRGGRSA